MLSPENFIRWTFEDFLRPNHIVPYTYFPVGTRQLKNLTDRTGDRGTCFLFNSCLISFDDVVDYQDLLTWKKQYHDQPDYYPDGWFNITETMNETEVIDVVLPSLSKPLLIANQVTVTQELEQKFLFVPVLLSALVSRYWFWRYRLFIDFQPKLERIKNQFRFLCYIDQWSQQQSQYKLYLLDQLVTKNVNNLVKCWFNQHSQGLNYREIKSIIWGEINNPLEDHYLKPVNSNSEFDIIVDDFETTTISLIASDYFENTQPIITKNIFKAIAAGHPFILLSAANTLTELKSLGFKTFDMFWDESYDEILDHRMRVDSVITVVEHISKLSATEFSALYQGIIEICEYNKKYFFSDSFEQLILDQYNNNLLNAIKTAERIESTAAGGTLLPLYHKHQANVVTKKNIRNLKEHLKGPKPKLLEQLKSKNLFDIIGGLD